MADESAAVLEGRRIYVGNLLYHIRPDEVTELLTAKNFTDFEHIHISVDPITGRNPGYCFVEFESKDSADRAITALAGAPIQGRPVKTGPCQPKKQQRQGGEHRPMFQRWGNWNREAIGAPVTGQGPYGAEEHLTSAVDDDGQRRRVWVGGLPKMINQEENDKEMRALFEGFKVSAIGKRITPHESTRSKPGQHHYCFVDCETREEALAAIEALDGRLTGSGKLRVSLASGLPVKIVDRANRSEASNWRNK